MARVRLQSRFGQTRGYTRTKAGAISWDNQDLKPSGQSECVDDTGRKVPHSLAIRKFFNGPPKWNGWVPPNQSGFSATECVNYTPLYLRNGSLNVENLLPSPPNNSMLGTRMLARTNPGRPHVSVPVFVGELRDLPHLIRWTGESLLNPKHWRNLASKHGARAKFLAEANLGWRFGWAPLLSDLKKMILFTDAVTRRETELRRLYHGGLKRRMTLDTAHQATNTSVVLDSVGFENQRAIRHAVQSRKIWGTVRWTPTTHPDFRNDQYMHRLARKAVFGMRLSPADVWELMPWSWLADWFGNVGDFLEATNNSIPVKHGPVCIMSQTDTTYVYSPTSHKHLWGGESSVFTHVAKNRTVVNSAALSASFPALTGSQLSILGSLAFLRLRRKVDW